MIDSFIGGVMTLAVLFFMFVGVVMVSQWFPPIGILLFIIFVTLVITTVASFASKER
jgi:Flp pilus assembly protein TadB